MTIEKRVPKVDGRRDKDEVAIVWNEETTRRPWPVPDCAWCEGLFMVEMCRQNGRKQLDECKS